MPWDAAGAPPAPLTAHTGGSGMGLPPPQEGLCRPGLHVCGVRGEKEGGVATTLQSRETEAQRGGGTGQGYTAGKTQSLDPG